MLHKRANSIEIFSDPTFWRQFLRQNVPNLMRLLDSVLEQATQILLNHAKSCRNLHDHVQDLQLRPSWSDQWFATSVGVSTQLQSSGLVAHGSAGPGQIW